MKKDPHISARAVPWNPIPEEAASWFAVHVECLEWSQFQDQGRQLSLLLYSQWADDAGRHRGLWRLEFDRVEAYQMSGSGFWFRRLPLDLPSPESGLWSEHPSTRRALWEVKRSEWLDQVADSHGQGGQNREHFISGLHHYAIVDDVIALYEIAARGVTPRRLSDEEANTLLALYPEA